MNIEKTISEQAVSDILTPMLESQDRIVTEDVAPLFDKATGLDTPPASGTVTPTIEESRSVITAIIRKAWTATLTMLGGASVISYIAAAYTYLRNRLQGNETYGIPDRRSEISASSPLAANLALLNDRKIGGADCQDGMSLVRLMNDSASAASVTELTDTTYGWTNNKYSLGMFPSATKIQMNCKIAKGRLLTRHNASQLELPELEEATTLDVSAYGDNAECGVINQCPNLTILNTPKLWKLNTGAFQTNFLQTCDNLEQWIAENFTTNYMTHIVHNCPKLWKIVWGKLAVNIVSNSYYNYAPFGGCPNLIHLEIGAGVDCSQTFAGWNPSYVLSDNPTGTDLIEEGSTAQNNLQQFLSNFREFIANRLTDNGSGLTLTLSQAVRNAIHAAEATYGIENIIITQKGWTISPAPN